MPASSKRTRRIKAREQDYKQTGVMRKAKKAVFDTKNESDEVVRDIGNRRKFRIQDLVSFKPGSLNQERFFQHYYDGIPIIALLGSAGSGKSIISLYAALSQVFDESTPYDRVILVRSAVQSRNQGYLPGGLDGPDGKMAPYEMPYIGLTKEIMPKFNNGYEHLKSLGYLEFHSTSFLRSATFENAIIICSECQNLDFEELYTVCSRAGVNSRIILEGDERQTDLQRQREKSGVGRLERVLKNMPASMTAVIEFTEDDILRSELVKQFIISCNRTQ